MSCLRKFGIPEARRASDASPAKSFAKLMALTVSYILSVPHGAEASFFFLATKWYIHSTPIRFCFLVHAEFNKCRLSNAAATIHSSHDLLQLLLEGSH